MKKRFLIFFLFSILLSSCSQKAYFNPVTNKIVCHNKQDCVHEIAHKYDNKFRVSQTDEFREFVYTYRMLLYLHPEYRDEFSTEIEFFPKIGGEALPQTLDDIGSESFWTGGWGGYSELYAKMAEFYYGKEFPLGLKDFYDTDYISDQLQKLGY